MPDIALLEDDALLRETLAELLEDQSFPVHPLKTAAATLDFLEQKNGQCVLIADRSLASDGTDGHALAAKALTRWPALKVIYISGAPEAADRPLSDRESVLIKPFQFTELLDLVRAMAG